MRIWIVIAVLAGLGAQGLAAQTPEASGTARRTASGASSG